MSGGWATRVRADVRPYVKPLRMGPGAIVPMWSSRLRRVLTAAPAAVMTLPSGNSTRPS